MRKFWNWAREVEWLAVLSVTLLVLAIALGIVAVWSVAFAPLAVVLGFGSLALASLAK